MGYSVDLKSYLPGKNETYAVYILSILVFLFHTLDISITFIGVSMNYVTESDAILRLLFRRIGITGTMIIIWFIGLVVSIAVCLLSLWLERVEYYYPIPTLFLACFLSFVGIIKFLTVIWNLNILSQIGAL